MVNGFLSLEHELASLLFALMVAIIGGYILALKAAEDWNDTTYA